VTHGIELDGENNIVQGNFIGTNPAGDIELGNEFMGILSNGANTIGGDVAAAGNVIASNGGSGIDLESGDNTVQGNIIGLSPDGTTALPNSNNGILVNSSFNHIGGATPEARNVISGNVDDGILINGMTNIVEGNYVGTTSAGDEAIPNG